MRTLASLSALFLFLSACSSETPLDEAPALDPSALQVHYAEDAQPSDPNIAKLYTRSCSVCHAVKGMNAPLTGHKAAWKIRYDVKGIEGLLQSSKFGFKDMPAKGLCLDCSDAELIALINFMMEDSQ